MEINAFIGNPIIRNHDDFNQLKLRIDEIAPNLRKLHLFKDRMKVEITTSRTFKYPKNPTIEWTVGRIKYMIANGL